MDAQRGIARRMVIGLPASRLSAAWERDFAAYPPGGVILFGRDFQDLEGLRRLTTHLRELARPRRLFLAIDEEGGHVSQLAGHLVVPPNALTLARGAAPGDLEWVARVTGMRLRALGIDWVFAPVADIHSEPRNPVIGPRAYGANPGVVANNVREVLRGLRAAGVASCLKHFPGHGDTLADSHVSLPVNDRTRAELEAREIVPFRANLAADAIMTAHVVYRGLDPDHPATFSRGITHDLLRDTLGFAGVTITDALEMKGAAGGTHAQVAQRALEAGADLLLFAFHDESLRRARLDLARALTDGGLDRVNFDAARPRLAALDHAYPEPDAQALAAPLDSLTPPDWERRLETIVERALAGRGGLPEAARTGPWRVVNAGPDTVPPIAAELEARGIHVPKPDDVPLVRALAAAGVPLADDASAATACVAVVASRLPLDATQLGALRALARAGPTIGVGLQNDAFLADLPDAVMTLSAADRTPLTQRVVARRLASLRG
jgi:beta-N-acetylhexosaminidase